MRKACLFFVLFILFASQAIAADPLDKALSSGDIWKAMGVLKDEGNLMKKTYVKGYIEGSLFAIAYIGMLRSTIKQLPEIYDKELEGEKDAKLHEAICKTLLMTTHDQLDNNVKKVGEPLRLPNPQIVEGLDTFYADFKNRNIKIIYAIHIVNKQINGASEEETNAILEYLRGGMEDKSKLKYKDRAGTLQVAEFP